MSTVVTRDNNLVNFLGLVLPAGTSCRRGLQLNFIFRHALARFIKFEFLRPALGPRKLSKNFTIIQIIMITIISSRNTNLCFKLDENKYQTVTGIMIKYFVSTE